MSASHARKWEQSYQTQAPQKKQVKVVRKTSWITKGEKVLYSVASACLIAAGMYMVSFSSSTDSLNRDLQSLESTVQGKQVKNEGLLYEMKELSRPERITSIAKKHGLKIQDAEVKHASALNN
ncbi:cell division protein FtsL [Lentibacillus sp. N15]|uniref:cell division protein FtsL n=1 Tax=Lentibacillus songyuanensis TaxID=3136161 RepID=UPI0031BA2C48